MQISADRFYNVKEIVVANGGVVPLSVSAVYTAIKSGEIPATKIGRRLLIPGTYLQKLAEQLECTSKF